MSTTSVTYRELQECDVAACAQLHMVAFPGFFLSHLGPRFLAEFYGAHVRDPDAVTVVAVDAADHVQGVVVGNANPHGFYRRLLVSRWFAFIWASLGLVLRKPRVTLRLLRALTYRGEQTPWSRGALLSSICVAPRAQGSDLATELMARWTRRLQDHAVTAAHLSTDRNDNEKANRFYEKVGWQLRGGYTRQGREMNVYTWTSEQEDEIGDEGDFRE